MSASGMGSFFCPCYIVNSVDATPFFLDTMIHTPTFTFSDYEAIRKAVHHYKKEGDFTDLLIVNQALEQQAKKLFSFDKKLQKKFPGFVVEKKSRKDV